MRLAAALMLLAMPAFAAPEIGAQAPAFDAVDTKGRAISLSDYAGKPVVLEWTNHECPFVRAHYDSGVMQALQRRAAAEGVVWLTVVSSAPGQQGAVNGPEGDRVTAKERAAPTAKLLDPAGELGRLYDAKTTPHMFVIDATGALIYAGAIDNHPSADPAEAKLAHNYVDAALTALKTGQPMSPATTKAYGCSVKYGS